MPPAATSLSTACSTVAISARGRQTLQPETETEAFAQIFEFGERGPLVGILVGSRAHGTGVAGARRARDLPRVPRPLRTPRPARCGRVRVDGGTARRAGDHRRRGYGGGVAWGGRLLQRAARDRRPAAVEPERRGRNGCAALDRADAARGAGGVCLDRRGAERSDPRGSDPGAGRRAASRPLTNAGLRPAAPLESNR